MIKKMRHQHKAKSKGAHKQMAKPKSLTLPGSPQPTRCPPDIHRPRIQTTTHGQHLEIFHFKVTCSNIKDFNVKYKHR